MRRLLENRFKWTRNSVVTTGRENGCLVSCAACGRPNDQSGRVMCRRFNSQISDLILHLLGLLSHTTSPSGNYRCYYKVRSLFDPFSLRALQLVVNA